MAKGGGGSRKRNPSRLKSNGFKLSTVDFVDDDDVDAFHKQRDIVPLDVDDDMEGSEENDEQSVFDLKSANDDEEDDDDEDDDDEDEDTEDESQVTGMAAKLARRQKNLRASGVGVEDEMHDDSEDEEDKKKLWGRGKGGYYDADNKDYELQSSDEDAALEEKEAERLQREKAKFLYDVGQDESDSEPTLEEMRSKEKTAQKAPPEIDVPNDSVVAYEVVKKDLNALTKEEQMDVVNSSAPEIVGLLSELNNAVAELDDKINPLVSKVKNMGNIAKGGLHYLEVKRLLLLAYSQAITFYLLLKSEGQQVRDHPVIARLVEIKNLLDKMKQVDENLPSELEDIITKHQIESVTNLPNDSGTLPSDSSRNAHAVLNGTLEVPLVPDEAAEVVNVGSFQKNEKKRRKSKEMDGHIGVQSKEMLKVRAALEQKLKQKGLFGSITSKQEKIQKHEQLFKGQLMTLSDFDDEAIDKSKGNATTKPSSKRSQLATPQMQKSKIISGDDDIPMRDDIGERRRKHELRVLAGAGIKYTDNDVNNGDDEEPENPSSEEDVDMEEGDEIESEDDFYRTIKEQRAAKLAAKAELYSRTSIVAPVPEETLEDGKRHISNQMEKNRGLTRPRKKLIKNPRKKYKLAHKKALVRRKGQVRDIKKPMGPYGGETSGINAGISRSVRF